MFFLVSAVIAFLAAVPVAAGGRRILQGVSPRTTPCAAGSSQASQTALIGVRQLLDAGYSQSLRVSLQLPSTIGALTTFVTDSVVCRTLRTKQDSVLTRNYTVGVSVPDSTREVVVIAVDSMYVVYDYGAIPTHSISIFSVYNPGFTRVGVWR